MSICWHLLLPDSSISCRLDSSPQFRRGCPVAQGLHELSPCFVRCSFVVLVISWFICYRAGEVESLDLTSSRALILSNISAGTGSVFIRCRPEGICSDAAFRMMGRKIFLAVCWKLSVAPYTITTSIQNWRSTKWRPFTNTIQHLHCRHTTTKSTSSGHGLRR